MAKILHVIQILTLGGGARALLCTAKCSARQGDFGHTVVSILPPDAKAVQLARESGLRVVAAPGPAELAAEIEAADIVQMHWWNVPEMTDFIRARHPAMRLIGFYHVAGDSLPHIVTPKLIDYVDMSVPCNPYTYYDNPSFRDMEPAKKLSSVALVYGAADLDRLEGFRFKPHWGFNIGYIGTIDFIKMHPDYVRMSSVIRIPDAKFIVCGDGSLDVLRRQAAEAGAADRFEFRGYVDDVRGAISEFDLYGYPLCEETYAGSELNLQEIMFAGLAPVVFPYGGVKRLVVNDFTGLIVHSQQEYAQAVEYLYHHPAERRRLGRNAKAYAEQIFGAENAARKINAVYNRLLERPKRTREWSADVGPDPVSGAYAPVTGAEVFLDTLGEKAGADYYASRSGVDLGSLLQADARIAASTRVAFISGVLAYRGKYPEDPWLRYWAGLGFSKLGSHAEAALEFAEALKSGMPHWRARWRLAQAAEAVGRADLAGTVYAQLESQHPGYRKEIEAAQGGRASDPGAPAKASPSDIPSLAEPGMSAGNPSPTATPSVVGGPSSGTPTLSVEYDWTPGGASGDIEIFKRAECAFLENRGDEAASLLKAFLAGHPDHPRALNDLGVIRYAQGREEEAMVCMAKALKADPGYDDALANLTQALMRAGRHEEALETGYASLEQRPDDNVIAPIVAAIEEDRADKLLARSLVRDLGYRKRPFRITALVSTYKSEGFMRECLDDLEGQTVAEELEIIVVDADSPEGESAIVESYQRRFDNIRYIRTPERIGIYPAWNLAIRAASGTFLTPMSTNDRLAPDAYERLMRVLDANPAVALAYGDSHLTRAPHQTFAKFVPVPQEEASFRWPEYDYDDLVVNCRVGPHPVWRASLHAEIGYFDGRYKAIADQDFWLRIAVRHPLMHLPAYTGLAWLTQDSLSGQSSAFHEIMRIHNLHASAYLARARRRHALAGYAEPGRGAPANPLPMQTGPAASIGPADIRVSAFVVAFDAPIAPCLENLFSQTLFRRGELEIVVAYSGAASEEFLRLDEFRSRHKRLVLLRVEGGGFTAAWNRAVAASHGRFLVLAQPEDRHRDDAFEILAEELERPPSAGPRPALAYADALLTAVPGQSFSDQSAQRILSMPEWSVRQALLAFDFGPLVMWRRELHAQLGLLGPGSRSRDAREFFFQAALAQGACHIRTPLVLHKERLESPSSLGGTATEQERRAFLAPYRRDLPLERIYPFLNTDPSPTTTAAAAIDLAACLLDPDLGAQAPAEAEARLWQALDAAGPSSEALIDLVVASQGQGKADLARAAFSRLLAFDPAFLRKLQGLTGRELLFRLDHPHLKSMPDLSKPDATPVRDHLSFR